MNIQVRLNVKQEQHITDILVALHILHHVDRSSPAISATADAHAWLASMILHNLLKSSSCHHLCKAQCRGKKSLCLQIKTQNNTATLCFEFLFLSFHIDTKHYLGRLNDLENRDEKSLPDKYVCMDWRFCSRKVMGGSRGRGEVRGCGKDSSRFGTNRCGWTSALLDWLRENIMLNSFCTGGFL